MKKVSSTKDSVFDDPLFNPGESYKSDESDYVAPRKQPPSNELLNTLAVSEEESLSSIAKPLKLKVNKRKPPSKDESVAGKEKETGVFERKNQPTTATEDVVVNKVTVDPLKTSVFEKDGVDLFLPDDNIVASKKKSDLSLEEELFGKSSSSSSSEMRSVKTGGSELRIGGHDNESKINDLGVGAILEREELDFDLFGKSKVRQYESLENADTTKNNEGNMGAVRKDDLVLESSDVLSDFESMLSDKGNSKRTTAASYNSTTTSSSTPSKAVVVDSSYDIDAYISQQEESSGGGLFD